MISATRFLSATAPEAACSFQCFSNRLIIARTSGRGIQFAVIGYIFSAAGDLPSCCISSLTCCRSISQRRGTVTNPNLEYSKSKTVHLNAFAIARIAFLSSSFCSRRRTEARPFIFRLRQEASCSCHEAYPTRRQRE